MAQLKVAYEPIPIPWVIPRDSNGRQRGPGRAHITLTVSAIDENTSAPVAGIVTSFTGPDPDNLIDDPNDLNFTTNRPQMITLLQVTSHEVPPGHPPLYLSPGVQVAACGYDNALLELD
jgi:hypothetical protein